MSTAADRARLELSGLCHVTVTIHNHIVSEMHLMAMRSLTQLCLTGYCINYHNHNPGVSLGSANQCIFGKVYLRFLFIKETLRAVMYCMAVSHCLSHQIHCSLEAMIDNSIAAQTSCQLYTKLPSRLAVIP